MCEPPSKSTVDVWYENIGYRSLGGAYRFVLLKSTLNNAKMQRNWLHGFRSLKCWEWNSKLLSLRLQPCWELSKHIPRLFPKEGYLLQTQL